MQIRRSSPGAPFPITIFVRKEDIDKMCLDELKKARLLPSAPGPIDVDALVENHFKARLDFGTDLGAKVMGMTVFSEKGAPMLVAISSGLEDGSKHAERRIRATTAHEAGHCLLHPILFMQDADQCRFLVENVDLSSRRILCREDDMKATLRAFRWWEYQANCAIGGFLLPRALVTTALEPFLRPSGLLGGFDVDPGRREEAARSVADIFNVNPIAARIRIGELFPVREDQELQKT